MALLSELLTRQYAGNGVTTGFSFPFYFLDATDLDVYLVDAVSGVEIIQSFVSAYDVIGAFNPLTNENDDFTGGASVVFTTAPPTGQNVFIIRNTPDTQDTSFSLSASYSSKVVETAFDKIVMMIQYIFYQLSRSLRFTDAANIGSFNAAIPGPITANSLVAVNALGTGMALVANASLAQGYVGTGAIPEESFNINNNQVAAATPTNTDYPSGITFANTIRSAEIDVQVYRVTTGGGALEYAARAKYLLTFKSTGYDLAPLGFGGDADASGNPGGVVLSVTSGGTLQYTSSNMTGSVGQQVIHLRANVMGV